MSTRNSIFIAFCSAVIFSANVIAKDIAIYRWVDENNVVHFSQHQPKNNNYSQLTTISSFRAREKELPNGSDKLSADDQLSNYEKDKAEVLAKNAETAEKNCKAAKLNEKTLNAFDKVMFTDSEGKNRALTDKEKKAQLELSKEHISLYCINEKDN